MRSVFVTCGADHAPLLTQFLRESEDCTLEQELRGGPFVCEFPQMFRQGAY